ncbi:MAG: hypothetical protein L3J28_01330 [Candidatus Polarisedimenticolaceae bacterium]|nr:hypothetical protein [Candidatus Polarisedimenticolaceae bacterium]
MSGTTTMNPQQPKQSWRPAPLDYLAFIAAIVNVLVIGYIVVNWFINN